MTSFTILAIGLGLLFVSIYLLSVSIIIFRKSLLHTNINSKCWSTECHIFKQLGMSFILSSFFIFCSNLFSLLLDFSSLKDSLQSAENVLITIELAIVSVSVSSFSILKTWQRRPLHKNTTLIIPIITHLVPIIPTVLAYRQSTPILLVLVIPPFILLILRSFSTPLPNTPEDLFMPYLPRLPPWWGNRAPNKHDISRFGVGEYSSDSSTSGESGESGTRGSNEGTQQRFYSMSLPHSAEPCSVDVTDLFVLYGDNPSEPSDDLENIKSRLSPNTFPGIPMTVWAAALVAAYSGHFQLASGLCVAALLLLRVLITRIQLLPPLPASLLIRNVIARKWISGQDGKRLRAFLEALSVQECPDMERRQYHIHTVLNADDMPGTVPHSARSTSAQSPRAVVFPAMSGFPHNPHPSRGSMTSLVGTSSSMVVDPSTPLPLPSHVLLSCAKAMAANIDPVPPLVNWHTKWFEQVIDDIPNSCIAPSLYHPHASQGHLPPPIRPITADPAITKEQLTRLLNLNELPVLNVLRSRLEFNPSDDDLDPVGITPDQHLQLPDMDPSGGSPVTGEDSPFDDEPNLFSGTGQESLKDGSPKSAPTMEHDMGSLGVYSLTGQGSSSDPRLSAGSGSSHHGNGHALFGSQMDSPMSSRRRLSVAGSLCHSMSFVADGTANYTASSLSQAREWLRFKLGGVRSTSTGTHLPRHLRTVTRTILPQLMLSSPSGGSAELRDGSMTGLSPLPRPPVDPTLSVMLGPDGWVLDWDPWECDRLTEGNGVVIACGVALEAFNVVRDRRMTPASSMSPSYEASLATDSGERRTGSPAPLDSSTPPVSVTDVSGSGLSDDSSDIDVDQPPRGVVSPGGGNTQALGVLSSGFLANSPSFDDSFDLSAVLVLLKSLQQMYSDPSDVAYHSRIHAVDVIQMASLLLTDAQNTGAIDLTPDIAFAFMIAAVAHDIKHKGVDNVTLVTRRHPLAQRYNDRGVMENYSASVGWSTVEESGVLDHLSTQRRNYIRELFLRLVLATDMSRHLDFMRRTDELDPDLVSDGKDREEQQQLYLCLLLKLADVGNPCRPSHLSRRWTELFMEEGFRLGDEALQRGEEVVPFRDRSARDSITPTCQLAFFAHVIAPFVDAMVELSPTSTLLIAMRDNLNDNTDYWQCQQAPL
eukprot:gnl/Dysnectes_brevis/2215_a2583_1296.p1 GENE.gnl/Dysnectes_brevis/2215_a2583_1296~~gnl/Dysnectes_brevis/2215_a2583_1296.p1  ORF type:complete len:1156 (+),score=251.87 gnl/Dysnectes_brevis/2215_a2583_1296:37-3504(+)